MGTALLVASRNPVLPSGHGTNWGGIVALLVLVALAAAFIYWVVRLAIRHEGRSTRPRKFGG